jgi:DNA polymerase elongation subunit (family B)
VVKKRYCGLGEDNELHATGLEMVRGDWSGIAQYVQRSVLSLVLKGNKDEKTVNAYIKEIIRNINKFPASYFIYERIVDTRKTYVVKTPIVKIWEAFNMPVKHENGIYRCVGPRGETLYGIRWLYGLKGKIIAIPENDDEELYKKYIDYNYYVEKQINPVVKRIFTSLDWELGGKQLHLL